MSKPAKVYPYLRTHSDLLLQYFGVFCTVMSVHVFFTYPETAQRTLEEVDALFDSNIHPWRSANVNTDRLTARVEEMKSGSVDGETKERFDDEERKEVA